MKTLLYLTILVVAFSSQVLANEVEDYDEDSKDLRNADDIEDEMDEESMIMDAIPGRRRRRDARRRASKQKCSGYKCHRCSWCKRLRNPGRCKNLRRMKCNNCIC
ncbi:uncharacterized protein LOC135691049 [Rhopilema esculentum]|uniref:uncharacterized protein LOC135691049 n=1 Tax=Rhopilema esculentum TaxID=499914 RepID=UPI0031D7C593